MPLLDTINLCHNFITRIENIDCLKALTSLHMTHNHLKSRDDIGHLKECQSLTSVDLSHNRLEDPTIVDIFSSMPNLKVLVLTGNPVRSKIHYYRKTMVVECKNLTYLDDRPIFEIDRDAYEAWAVGGDDAEEAARKAHRDKEMKKIRDSVYALINMRDRTRAAKKQEDDQESPERRRVFNKEQQQLYDIFDKEIEDEEGSLSIENEKLPPGKQNEVTERAENDIENESELNEGKLC
ncbi:hypothetical protein GE061_011103 [Apolygus lucorum]|uniref:Dynein axonemal assembly factor 1 homolog n=1 Tax=Apolygus lucorum TaxID=248454 RepID=A0A8S9XXP6_APOLU|nr:hypothetical protein GE061_011103 [Apolygus lucorum]